jgi:predicted O-linked N-acetylglucosamine transferase (SPINDLY family)
MMAQSGRAEEAAVLLGRAAAVMPSDPSAHNNYGNVQRDIGRHLRALESYDRALAIQPGYVEAHYNRGITLQELKRHGEALASYDRAIALKPDYAPAWNNRGVLLRVMGRREDALASFDRAIALRPDYAEAHNHRGATLQDLGRLEEAVAEHERAIALRPNYAEALNNYGAALHRLGRLEEAAASYERALAVKPDYVEALNNRGVTLHALERYSQALESFDRGLALSANDPTALSNRGITLRALKRFDEALASYERAIQLSPRFPDAYLNRGTVLQDLKRLPEALESYDRALFLGRGDADTYRNRGLAMEGLGYSEEAVASYKHALAIDPHAKFLRGVCRHARMRVCDWNGLEDDIAQLTAGIERGKPVTSPFALLSLIDSPELQRAAAEIWAREQCQPRVPLAPLPARPRYDKVRIGYFSADFRNHAVAALAAELFETHDRSRFELTAFSLGPDVRDELRTRVEAAFDRFLTVGGRSDEDIATLSRQLEIDVAVDLGGYTQDARPRIMALRPAPIQVSYLGYLGTMGGALMDYLIADPVLVPAEARRYYREKIAYLPSYQVNDSKRPVAGRALSRQELGLPPTGFVFCCLNASYKIAPETFASWMRILAAVPGSVLLLLGESAAIQHRLCQQAESRGIAPNRLIFGQRMAFGDYLARYRAADLFLDTLPYNAGTTASDALWAGLPVITCRGESFAARMAASILTAAGLPELIATDRAGYERLAVELAAEPSRLEVLRQRLEHSRPGNRLFDTPAFTRSIESLFQRMYERYCAGLPPEHLELP